MAKIKCTNCGTKFNGSFCPNCATPAPEGKKKKGGFGKVLLIILAVIIVLIVIGSLSGGSDVKKPENVASTNVDTKKDNAKAGDAVAEEKEEPAEAEEKASTASKDISVSEQEIYNENDVVVTVKGMENGILGTELSCVIENNSSSNILVTTRDLNVNGYMFESSGLYADVAAGKKSNESITLYSSEMQQQGVDTIANIEFKIHLSDSETWNDIASSEVISIDTSVAGSYSQTVDDSGDVVYDKDGIRVICKGLKKDSIWDGVVLFYMENGTGRDVSIYTENVSVNGFMEDASCWADILAGKRCVDAIYLWDLDDLELESMDDVENIEFNIKVVDKDNWDIIDTSDPITLNF